MKIRQKFLIAILLILAPHLGFAQQKGVNVIELRNDNLNTNEYLYATYRIAPEKIENGYFQENGEWKKHTYNNYGHTFDTDILWGVSLGYEKPDTVNRFRFPIYYIPQPDNGEKPQIYSVPCTRETDNCGVSHLFGDHQKDWDYLVDTLDGILAAKGLTKDSPDWDVIQTLADWISFHRGGGTYVHPVDYIDSVAECTGAANTLIAFAGILGIPARNLDFPFHASSEVYIDGKWRFVENTPSRRELFGTLQKYSANEMLVDPVGKGLTEIDPYNEATNHRTVGNDRAYHYTFDGYTNWRFHWRAAYDQEYWKIDMVPNSIYELSILYPEQDTLYYKGLKETKSVWLTPVKKVEASFKVEAGQALRRDFYLHTLRGINDVSSQILLDNEDESQLPEDGGDWYYSVNGKKYFVKDLGGFNVKEDHPLTGGKYIDFQIPAEALHPADEAVNYAPVLAEIKNPEPVLVNTGKQRIKISGISDGDFDAKQKLKISATTSDAEIIKNLKVDYKQGDDYANLIFSPLKTGVAKITVTVQDNGGNANGGKDKTSQSFDLLVYDGNTREIGLAAEADGYIRHKLVSKLKSGHADSLVTLKTWNEYFNRESFIRFDLSGIPYPINATLTLNGKSTGNTQLIVYGVRYDTWCEKQLSGDNIPYGFVALDTIQVTNSGVYEFDVTDFVQNQEDDKVSFKIEPLYADSIVSVFKSSESLNGFPELVIKTHGFPSENEKPYLNNTKILATDDVYVQRNKTAYDVNEEYILVHTAWNSHNGYNAKSSGIGVLKFKLENLPKDFDKVYMSLTIKDGQSSEENKKILKNPVQISLAEIPPTVQWDENTMDYEYATIIGTDRKLFDKPYNYSVNRFLQIFHPENVFADFQAVEKSKTYFIDVTSKVNEYRAKGLDELSVFLFERDRTEDGKVISTSTPIKFYSTESPNISRDNMPCLVVK